MFAGGALCFGYSAKGQAQTESNPKNIPSLGRDSLVHIAYRTVDKKDQPGAISILNPPQYLDKHFGNYPLEGSAAFVGGNNFWNIGAPLVLIDGVPRSVNDITANEIEQISFFEGGQRCCIIWEPGCQWRNADNNQTGQNRGCHHQCAGQ